MRRLLTWSLCAVAIALAGVRPAAAQARFAVIVQGASGDPQYATQHRGWVDGLAKVLRERLGIDGAHLFLLTEEARAGELKSTAENVKVTLAGIAKTAKADDLVFVMLIGHGGGDGPAAKFNLVGPDLTGEEWSALLQPISARLAVVDSTSLSFAYLAGLAGKNRVIITATGKFGEKYHTFFPEAFITALTATEADADKNGRVSLLEAFTYASRLVAQHYEQVGYLSTETAMIDDNGDGKGRSAAQTGDDGPVAALTYLDAVAMPTSSDPAIQALLTRQQQLTEQVDDLRRRRAAMTPEEFDRDFEKLIIELATVSRDVRKRTGK
ncbi:MAG TPA: hypothetical protein VFV78_04950 [Vicinamibacterales bacterium]|nr:hypothetical protein [Vicinamibacterales bacterium]